MLLSESVNALGSDHGLVDTEGNGGNAMEGGAFFIGNAVTSVKVSAATVRRHHVSWFDVQFNLCVVDSQ